MIGLDMFDFLTDLFSDSDKPAKETIIVAKPVCTPARHEIYRIFNHYGVRVLGFKESWQFEDGHAYPSYTEAKVTVSSKQAVWAEYLLLRSQKFLLMSKPKDKRNFDWALKHKQMPESWNGKPLIEKNCKEGIQALKRKKK